MNQQSSSTETNSPAPKGKPQIKLWPTSASHQRLESATQTLRKELPFLLQIAPNTKQVDESMKQIVAKVEEQLQEASSALERGKMHTGWHCIHTAWRLAIFGMSQKGQAALACTVLQEGQKKLGIWRKNALEAILLEKGELKSDLAPEELAKACEVLHEHYNNVYLKLAAIKRQLAYLDIIGILVVTGWIVLATQQNSSGTNPPPPYDRYVLLSVVSFGLMGACVSGILSVARKSAEASIPDLLVHSSVTTARLVVGALAALAVYTFLMGGVFQFAKESLGLILPLSFAAGFSEKLVERAVQLVAEQPK